MKLRKEHIRRLERFLEGISGEVYPEPPTATHTEITKKMVDYLCSKFVFPSGAKILDVGCGQGVALDVFRRKNFCPVGVTLAEEDVAACVSKGHEVRKEDQSFLSFEDDRFDCVWCRHCLEHSIFPAYTLAELYRVIKPAGLLYAEVPAPDTCCRHQQNSNHYSVLGKSMWYELMKQTGFDSLEVLDINHVVPAGPDVYWAFIQQKKKLER